MPEEVNIKPIIVADKADKAQKRLKVKEGFLNKVIIRKLPPNLSETAFLDSISPIPEYFHFTYVSADWTLGADATSRAYIEFKNQDDIFVFKDKFDGYVFVDGIRGSEYPAIVEYAPFQGLAKSRSRKKDKNVGTIEGETHFLNFIESLKADETEVQEPKLEYSYQIKDDKKVTSTPLLEFIANKNQEKRDAKKKKKDDQKKKHEDKKAEKKIQVIKNIPEPIKESKEEVVYDDGVVVRTVPSRLGRDRGGGGRKEKSDPKPEKDEKDKAKRDEEREARRKMHKEKDEKRRLERDQRREEQKSKNKEARESRENRESREPKENDKQPQASAPSTDKKDPAPAKKEVKRYSELRKARQEKASGDVKASVDEPSNQDEVPKSAESQVVSNKDSPASEPSKEKPEVVKETQHDRAKNESRQKRLKELHEKRAREADERAQRRIKNKDRPAMEIYQPKRRVPGSSGGKNDRSSDENSETSRKRSDSDVTRNDRRERKFDKKPRSKDESHHKKKNVARKNSDAGEKSESGEGVKFEVEPIDEKLENLVIGSPKKDSIEEPAEIQSPVIESDNDKPTTYCEVNDVDDATPSVLVVETDNEPVASVYNPQE